MLRGVLGVIAGYVVMFVLIMITFTIAYLLMGTGGAFKEGTYDVTGLWILASIVLSALAAVGGGFACAAISRSAKAPLVLAAIVLVLGIAMAVPSLSPDEGEEMVRTGDVGNMEAMQNAQQPGWLALATPFIGAAGILLGTRFKGSPKMAAPGTA
jgi:hypothetical protein